MDDHQKCIKCCQQYVLLAMQIICPADNHHCRDQALDCTNSCCCLMLLSKGLSKEKQQQAQQLFRKITFATVGNTCPYLSLVEKCFNSEGVFMADAQHEFQIGHEHSIVDQDQYCGNTAISHFINNLVQNWRPWTYS